MRDRDGGSGKARETFDVSLDGRQIASIVVGSLVILGVVFVLGLNVGRQIALRQVQSEGNEDALAALDRPPAPPEPVREDSLTFHDRLTKPPPAAEPPAAQAAPAPAPAPAPEAPAAEPAPQADEPAPGTAAAFSIQLGASQDRVEAERIAARFKTYHPRVESAEIAGKGTWYRVRIGAFQTREAAERYLKDLARETGVKGYVASGP
jgi:cell division protein FtsN